MKSNEDIPVIFERILREGKEIRLVNVYKGFPISYEGTLLAIDRKSIQIKTNPFQVVCIYQERETYLRSELLPHVVQAGVMRVDFAKSEAVLSRFEYVSKGIGERKQVRVEPAEQVKGTIKNNERKFNLVGEIADISLDGLALLLSPGLQAPKMLREGTRVTVHVSLPIEVKNTVHPTVDLIPRETVKTDRFSGIKKPLTPYDGIGDTFTEYPAIYSPEAEGLTQKEFTFEGLVVNVVADKALRKHRIGVRILSAGPQRSVISQFILQRQTTILNEIRDLYTVLKQASANLQASWKDD